MTPTTTHPNTRASQISACIESVAKHFHADPRKVLTAFAPKNPDVVRSRIFVWYHLHRSGMSFAAIGRIFGKLSADNVARRVRYGVLSMTDEERLMLDKLPVITSSVEIFQAGTTQLDSPSGSL